MLWMRAAVLVELGVIHSDGELKRVFGGHRLALEVSRFFEGKYQP